MPELKNTFTGGKMEKDLDERIVPSGQYREALNISVATSEGSDVGAAQNILGNTKVTKAIQSRTMAMTEEYKGDNYHVAEVIDPLTDMLYRFIHTASEREGVWMDRIVEFNTESTLNMPWEDKESAVVVDIFKVTSRIDVHDNKCETTQLPYNKSKIKISKNLNQIRWGMKVVGLDIPDPNPADWADGDVTVEDVDYVNGWITLNKPTWIGAIDSDTNDQPITFYGDRNLSFGDTEPSGSKRSYTSIYNGIKNITGINIIDGMIFWTDNSSEPKKVNIERSKKGSHSAGWNIGRGIEKIDDFNQHTLLIVDDVLAEDCVKDDSFCPPAVTWDCDGFGFCYDPFTGNGAYADKATCQDNCIAPKPSWNCTHGGCIDPGNGSGSYLSLSVCQLACTTTPSWDCNGQSCFDPGTGLGQYSSLPACQTACVSIPCTSLSCVGPNVSTPDNDFEQELINLGYDSTLDGHVFLGNIDTVTTLGAMQPLLNQLYARYDDCYQYGTNCGVTDFTGVQCFADLEIFMATSYQANPILDLQQNSNLLTVDLNIPAITTLDFTCNPLLYSLKTKGANIFYPSLLQSVDITNNPNLHTLYLRGGSGIDYNNQPQQGVLSTLDVSNNLALEIVRITNQSLASLDFSPHTNLKKVELANNNLSALDISNSGDLYHLDIRDNPITSIDVSNLERTSGGTPPPNSIYIDNTNITQIDLSNVLNSQYGVNFNSTYLRGGYAYDSVKNRDSGLDGLTIDLRVATLPAGQTPLNNNYTANVDVSKIKLRCCGGIYVQQTGCAQNLTIKVDTAVLNGPNLHDGPGGFIKSPTNMGGAWAIDLATTTFTDV